MKYTKQKKGFTLMEIIVSTVIFAIVASSLLSLFNYVLKINRRSEALRQASQGMRDFVEYLVKEVRNGQINYGYVDPGGETQSSLPFPCSTISSVSTSTAAGYGSLSVNKEDNKLGLFDTDNKEVCIYYGKADNTYVGDNNFTSAQGGDRMLLAKVLDDGSPTVQALTPTNFKVEQAMFLVRPVKDPYTLGNVKAQPFVTMMMHFKAILPTGEQVPIYYQTTVSTSKYDISN